MKKLSNLDLAKIDSAHKQIKIHDLEIELKEQDEKLIEQSKKFYLLQVRYLDAQAQLKKGEIEQMQKVKKDFELKHAQHLQEIAKRLKIKGKWGFDPLTGEIK